MKKALLRFLPFICATAVTASLTGCMDDSIDIDDIDTTVRVGINDLTIPVNMDAITLSSIFSLDDEDMIKEYNGEYALVESGKFNSEALSIPDIEIAAPPVAVSPTVVSVPKVTLPSLPGGITITNELIAQYGSLSGLLNHFGVTLDNRMQMPINDLLSQFDYAYTGFSSEIVKVDRIGTDLSIGVTISISGIDPLLFTSVKINDLKIKMPAGLNSPDSFYDKATGIVSLGDIDFSHINGYTLAFSMQITGIEENGSTIKFDYNNHSISFIDKIGIESGMVDVTFNIDAIDITAPDYGLPTSLAVTSQPILSKLKINTFTGIVTYNIDNIGIDPISLDDLPDVLTGSTTNIRIGNPQIYLSLNEPAAINDAHIYVRAGINIDALRQNGGNKTFPLDRFYIGPFDDTANGINYPWQQSGEYQLCISPEKPAKMYDGFANAVHVPFPGLGDILSGEGLPNSIKVELVSPEIPQQQITDFRLGDFGPVTGRYTLYAPLSIASGSTIEYSDETDPIDSEDLTDLTINQMSVSVKLTSTLPLGITLSGEVLDSKGNVTGKLSAQGIKAFAKNETVVIGLSDGPVRDLNKIRFTAQATADNPDNKALSPNETISLSDIRIRVSGYYETEL